MVRGLRRSLFFWLIYNNYIERDILNGVIEVHLRDKTISQFGQTMDYNIITHGPKTEK